jgi:AcrR family transcriptional regulator
MSRLAAPADVREEILDAATHLMEQYGYKKMTMEDIAHEARIGKATIYGYFANKEEVALSVIERYNRCILVRFRTITEEQEPPAARLKKMLLERVVFGFDLAQKHRQSLDETLAALRPLILAKREQQQEAEAQFLATVLKEGRNAGVFLFDDSLAAAKTLLHAISGLLPYSLSPRELSGREEIIRRAEQVIGLLFHGLLTCHERNEDV